MMLPIARVYSKDKISQILIFPLLIDMPFMKKPDSRPARIAHFLETPFIGKGGCVFIYINQCKAQSLRYPLQSHVSDRH